MPRALRPRASVAAGLAAVLLLGGAALPPARAAATPAPSSSASPAPAHWDYHGAAGPEAWGAHGGADAACAAGTAQSPVALPAPAEGAPTGGRLVLTTARTTGRLDDTGHTVQLVPSAPASTVRYEGTRYRLQQIHFHTPAEHLIDGHRADVELHLVHAAADGRLLVLGVLAEWGAASTAWEPYVQAIAAGGGGTRAFDVAAMLPASLRHVAYTGSLTTPPCTEGVTWIVFGQPVTLSAPQLAVLTGAYSGTARPVQPLGDRTVRTGEAVAGR